LWDEEKEEERGDRKKGVLEEVDQLSLIMCMTIKGLIKTVNLKKETKKERKRVSESERERERKKDMIVKRKTT